MRFSTLLTAAAASSVSSAAAVAARTDIHVTDFYAQSNPHSVSASYHFHVSGRSTNADRSFDKIRCHMDETSEGSYQELIPVHKGRCDDNTHVTFNFNKYFEDGEYAGWKLEVDHTIYADNSIHTDKAVQFFPKSHIKYALQGGVPTGRYQYVKGPKNFHVKANLVDGN